jgi:hypothetical protein
VATAVEALAAQQAAVAAAVAEAVLAPRTQTTKEAAAAAAVAEARPEAAREVAGKGHTDSKSMILHAWTYAYPLEPKHGDKN